MYTSHQRVSNKLDTEIYSTEQTHTDTTPLNQLTIVAACARYPNVPRIKLDAVVPLLRPLNLLKRNQHARERVRTRVDRELTGPRQLVVEAVEGADDAPVFLGK